MTLKKTWYEVLSNISELEEGSAKTIYAGSTKLCLVNYKERYLAIKDESLTGETMNDIIIDQLKLQSSKDGMFYYLGNASLIDLDDRLEVCELRIKDGVVYVAIEE